MFLSMLVKGKSAEICIGLLFLKEEEERKKERKKERKRNKERKSTFLCVCALTCRKKNHCEWRSFNCDGFVGVEADLLHTHISSTPLS